MLTSKYNFPSHSEILDLEKKSNKEGSGITYKDLNGVWKFQYVWKKKSDHKDNISSSILQVLSANLELSYKDIENELHSFVIKNSIKFGIISIIFSGNAYLKGNRPLLLFSFKSLVIKCFNVSIFDKSLQEINQTKMPFFSLIAIQDNKKWLCARGKGGGIAIWIKS